MGLWTPTNGVGADEAPTPWQFEPWGGYARYQHADDGTWYQMLEPLANGYGLFVAFAAPDICCCPASAQAALQVPLGDGLRVPWLFPGIVRWISGINPETGLAWGRIDGDASDDYGDTIEGPPVIITDYTFPDDANSMLLVNTTGDMQAQFDEASWDTEGPPAQGIAVPWQLVPIPEAKALELRDYINQVCKRYDTHVLAMTNCDLSNNYGETDEWRECHCDEHMETHPCRCKYQVGTYEGLCSCGAYPTYIQQYVALRESDVEGHDFLPPEDRALWDYALARFVAGHTVTYKNMEAGDAWSSSSWRQLSPFLDSDSLELLLQRPSPGSTTSGTPQGSSPGSSQLSMPFAS